AAIANQDRKRPAALVGGETRAQVIISVAQKSRSGFTLLHAAIEHVVLADFERRGVQRLALLVVEHQDEAALAVVRDRSDHVGGILDRDRRALLRNLQV